MNNIKNIQEQVIPLLVPYAKKVSLIGSFARGDEGSNSDIDLLVKLRSPNNRPKLGLKWFGLEIEIGHILGHTIELISEDTVSPYIKPYIENDRIILYEEG
ncbi:MAG: nucleotidyltransferase domain-containing protein [Candidatus Magnetomorum sp.]|nr:nucleotidyltransferase domain-containing protein [Candidatus Magnetomorum sp.]